MTFSFFFNQKVDNGVNEGLGWLGINLMVSKILRKTCFVIWQKSHTLLILKFANSIWSLLLSYI